MNDDGVAGVVAAGVARDDVEFFAEDVNDFAFAFVAPLGSEDDGGLALVLGLAHERVGSGVLLGGSARGMLAPMIHFILVIRFAKENTMQIKEAVQQASKYLPDVFDSAAGRELRLEGVEKTDDSRFWTIAFSYTLGDSGFDALSRDYKTVKLRDSDGELIGARNGVLLGEM